MIVGVDFVTALHEDDLRAHAAGIGDDSSGAHAKGFGFVTGGDANGCVCHHGNDADRAAAQLGTYLLLDGGEVGVEIDEKPVHAGSGGWLGWGRWWLVDA